MPDKKLTDNEIKKALECCVGDNDGKNCFDCPLWEIDDCQEQLLLDALDVINRPQAKVIKEQNKNSKLWNERNSLQAEVERLNKEVDRLSQCVLYHDGQIVDAVKEFAEKLKNKYKPYVILGSEVAEVEIDNLLKELAGENNETKTF